MSIISSPFDLGANLFTQQYAAVTPGEGGSIGSEYDTAGKIRSGWRNCKLTTGQAKTKMAGVLSESTTWSDGEWTDFLESELKTFYPVNRYRSCEVSGWSAWSDCVGGKQTRTRTITQPRLQNCVEKPCGQELTEERSCEMPDDRNGGGNGGEQEGCPRGDENREAADEAGECGSCLDGFIDDDTWGCVEDTTTDDTDADTDSLGDKLKEHWMLIGLGIVGLALLG